MGPLHLTGQLKCPYSMAAGAPQQVIQESQEEIPVPTKSPVSYHWLASLRLGGTTRTTTANGQAHWGQHEAADHTRYSWGSTSFSPSSHPQCLGAAQVLEIHWCWWHGASFRAMGCSHWPVLERPCSSPAAEARWMNAPLLADPPTHGAI